jgi:hypothetical protein
MPQAALKRRAIPAVAIVNQKSWRPSIPSAAFDHLLGRPLRGRIWRHRYVQNLSVDVSDHEKDVQSLEQDCSHAEEVTSLYIRFMPSQELAPSRGWPSIMAGAHVLGDGPGRNLKSQSCEFGLDSFLTPEPVLSSHLPDEGLKVLGNRPSTNPPVLAI